MRSAWLAAVAAFALALDLAASSVYVDRRGRAGARRPPRRARRRRRDAGPRVQGPVHRHGLRRPRPARSCSSRRSSRRSWATRSGSRSQPYARYRIVDPLRFYQALRTPEAANVQLGLIVSSAARRALGQAPLHGPAHRRARKDPRRHQDGGRGEGRAARRIGRRGAVPPRRPAVRDQPGDLRPHEIRAPARGEGVARARLRMGAADPGQGGPRPHRASCPRPNAPRRSRAARATPRRTGRSRTPSRRTRSSTRWSGRSRPTRARSPPPRRP